MIVSIIKYKRVLVAMHDDSGYGKRKLKFYSVSSAAEANVIGTSE